MRGSSIAWLFATTVLGASLGCSPTRPRVRKAEPTRLDRQDDLQRWELLTRPDLVFMLTALMAPEDSDSACPSATVSESEPALTLFTGNCTDRNGRAWHGQAERWRWNADGHSIQRARMREYGGDDLGITGFTYLRHDDSNHAKFFVDVEMNNPELLGDPTWLAMRYRGARGDEGWSGRGSAAVDGWGSITARTEGMRFDGSRCKSEPVAGKTILSAGRHEVEIEYDGASDCDKPGTAKWSFDGEPRGELTGVSGEMGCSPSDDERGGKPPAGAWLVLLSVFSPRLRRLRGARR